MILHVIVAVALGIAITAGLYALVYAILPDIEL